MKSIVITHCPGLLKIELIDPDVSDFHLLLISDERDNVVDEILQDAQRQGYDISQAVWIEQETVPCRWYQD